MKLSVTWWGGDALVGWCCGCHRATEFPGFLKIQVAVPEGPNMRLATKALFMVWRVCTLPDCNERIAQLSELGLPISGEALLECAASHSIESLACVHRPSETE